MPLVELGKQVWVEWKSRVLFWTVKYDMPIRHPNRVKYDMPIRHPNRNLDVRRSLLEIDFALQDRCSLKLWGWSDYTEWRLIEMGIHRTSPLMRGCKCACICLPERASQREKSHDLELFSLEMENRVILTDTGYGRGPGFQETGRKRRQEGIMS